MQIGEGVKVYGVAAAACQKCKLARMAVHDRANITGCGVLSVFHRVVYLGLNFIYRYSFFAGMKCKSGFNQFFYNRMTARMQQHRDGITNHFALWYIVKRDFCAVVLHCDFYNFGNVFGFHCACHKIKILAVLLASVAVCIYLNTMQHQLLYKKIYFLMVG